MNYKNIEEAVHVAFPGLAGLLRQADAAFYRGLYVGLLMGDEFGLKAAAELRQLEKPSNDMQALLAVSRLYAAVFHDLYLEAVVSGAFEETASLPNPLTED